MWYNSNDILSYNCLFNFVVGNRGGGKTYEAKKKAIKRFLNNGEQTIYLRRYKAEIKKIAKFFDDICVEFPNHEFKVIGKEFYCRPKDSDEKWEQEKFHLGGAIALSTALTEKSVPYPKVSFIIFDEFITDNKSYYRYLPSEVDTFLDMYETICRSRDNIRVLFLANALSVVNPYFLYFGVQLNGKRFVRPMEDVVVEVFKDSDFVDMKKNTRFGRLISKTRYGQYAIENEFKNDTDDFIEKRSVESKLETVLHFNGVDIGFWYDFKNGKIYASMKHDKTCPFYYVLKRDDHKENLMLVKNYRDNYYIQRIMKAFELGYLFYENQQVKSVCFEIMKTLHYS